MVTDVIKCVNIYVQKHIQCTFVQHICAVTFRQYVPLNICHGHEVVRSGQKSEVQLSLSPNKTLNSSAES